MLNFGGSILYFCLKFMWHLDATDIWTNMVEVAHAQLSTLIGWSVPLWKLANDTGKITIFKYGDTSANGGFFACHVRLEPGAHAVISFPPSMSWRIWIRQPSDGSLVHVHVDGTGDTSTPQLLGTYYPWKLWQQKVLEVQILICPPWCFFDNRVE